MIHVEGQNAFTSFQNVILNRIDNHSIFAGLIRNTLVIIVGLPTPRPSYFAQSRDIVPYRPDQSHPYRKPYTMTNAGLRIQLMLHPTPFSNQMEDARTFIAQLDRVVLGA